jgi:gluconate 2-dehydrogenase alpha chain
MTQTYGRTPFAKAAPMSACTRFHVRRQTCRANPLGLRLGSYTYRGFCEKLACGNYSKASAQTTIIPVLMGKSNFTLKTQCEVTNNLDNSGKHAKSVTYVDAQGDEYEQPVELIVLGSYNLHTFICC